MSLPVAPNGCGACAGRVSRCRRF